MAKIEFTGIDQYSKQLNELYEKSEAICKKSIYDAVGMVVEAVKENVPVSNDKRTSGDLKDGVISTEMTNENGYISSTVTFEGYDSKGAPLRLIARTLESGRSTSDGKKVGKHQFFRKAVDSVRKAAQFSIENELIKNIKIAMK